ncbi:TetR/AcrR family transcriptional regulator [Mesorhizobium koreense]|uniref:TetR/AcrR family transcriptional regulator n=1 Tax=Mesorhizobium koreense TaxID=3074855 RepID=UPI00287B83B7|nr:TetR family transcriptional regulator [Mesorhizobium sp. WR6]
MTQAEIPNDTRSRIGEALLALMADGERLNHDNVAARAGISRRTVYRHFPDQVALRKEIWTLLSSQGKLPTDLSNWLTTGIPRLYRQFDERAAAATVAMASAEGRAMRNSITPDRVEAYRALYAKATASLPEPDRTHAVAALQFIGSGFAWREMRDQWGMDGEAISTTVLWAIRTLLADLEKRGGRPLSDGPASPD